LGSNAHFTLQTMRETWLKPNSRVLQLGLLLPAFVLAVGLVLLALEWRGRVPPPIKVVGIILMVIGALGVVAIIRELRRPRLAYENGEVLVYLRPGAPIRVPVEIVECFLIGQGASL